MKRRVLMLAACGAAITWPLDLTAQPPGKAHRIGFLSPTPEPQPVDQIRLATLRGALRDLGWVDGKNVIIESRHAGLDVRRQRELAAELRSLPVAMILAAGTATIRAARDGAPGVPIVMVNAGDPLGAGFVASLARPGGEMTGTSAAGEEILAKQVELLMEVAPLLKRVGVLMNTTNPANDFFFDAMSVRGRALGLQLDRIDVTAAGDLEGAVAHMANCGLIVLGDPLFGRSGARITELALQYRVAAVFGGREYVAIGGLMSYLSSDAWHWRRAASFIDKILKGAKPGDLPVEQPTQFELIINLKTAKALGLTFPASILARADEVIE